MAINNLQSLKERNLKLIPWLESQGYQNIKELGDGTVVATSELMFTRALYIDLDFLAWDRRYCFKERVNADIELGKLVDCDSEPTGYIARRNG